MGEVCRDSFFLSVTKVLMSMLAVTAAFGACAAPRPGAATSSPTLPKGYVVQGGLTWTPNNLIAPDIYVGWDAANNFCTTNKFNGQSGWRLPTLAELNKLYESGAIAGHGWALHRTWSATPDRDGVHWLIVLVNGGMYDYKNDYRSSVTCVH